MPSDLPTQPNHGLIDGLACLLVLAERREAVGVSELASELGLEVTRTHRLLKTLAHLGLARQDTGRRYIIGPAIHVLSAQSMIASGLLHRAGGHLANLREYGHTVAMGVLWRTQVAYLYHARPGTQPIDSFAKPDLFDATRSGIGIVLLASKSDDEVRKLYQDQQIPGYPKGIDTLLTDLADVRKRGFARIVRTRRPLDATIAVPVGDEPYAAVAMSGNIRSSDVKALMPVLIDAVRRIEG